MPEITLTLEDSDAGVLYYIKKEISADRLYEMKWHFHSPNDNGEECEEKRDHNANAMSLQELIVKPMVIALFRGCP
jgi:hypothetical protein